MQSWEVSVTAACHRHKTALIDHCIACNRRLTWNRPAIDACKCGQVLRAKFEQHEDLCEVLLSTGDARLVESATVDNSVNRLWGEVNGKGKNMLGQLLMELRDQLRLEEGMEPKKRSRSRERLAA